MLGNPSNFSGLDMEVQEVVTGASPYCREPRGTGKKACLETLLRVAVLGRWLPALPG